MPIQKFLITMAKKPWYQKLLVLFCLYNFIGFGVFLFSENKLTRPYPISKFSFGLAEGLNYLYINPLSWIGLEKPFQHLQNSLYQSGSRNIPVADGESEVWWDKIYFAQYKSLYSHELSAYLNHPTKEKEAIFSFWLNAIYKHLEKLALKKHYADPDIQNQRLSIFASEAFVFINNQQNFYSRRSYVYSLPYFTPIVELHKPYLNNKKELDKVKKLLAAYLSLQKEALQSSEYTAFVKGSHFLEEPLFLYLASQTVLAHEQLSGSFTCKSPNVRIYLENINALSNDTSQGEPVINLDTVQTHTQHDNFLIKTFYNLNRSDQSQYVGRTLQQKCGLFKGQIFNEVEKVSANSMNLTTKLRYD